MNIYVEFLGNPEIYIENIKLNIVQKKTKAFFLYILFNKECTRDELGSIFWGDFSESDAKRSVRNSIYKIKTLIKEPIFITDGNTNLKINPSINLTKDIDIFVTEHNFEELLLLKEFIFLEKFSINNCLEFEKWVLSIRIAYEKMLLEKLEIALNYNIINEKFNLAKKFAEKIIEIDIYHEKSYLTILKYLYYNGQYNEAIKLFLNFEKLLKNDLNILPDDNIINFYNEIIKKKNTNEIKNNKENTFFGRQNELIAINDNYSDFLNEKKFSHYIIAGDIGTGKSELIKTFLDKLKFSDYLEIQFNFSEQKINYICIEKIIESFTKKIFTLNRKNIGDYDLMYYQIFKQMIDNTKNKQKHIVIYLKNIEFLDIKSFNILTWILNNFCNNIFFIIEFCQNYVSSDIINNTFDSIKNIKKIYLSPLNKNETEEYLEFYYNEKNNFKNYLDEIYNKTQGYFILLNEEINQKKYLNQNIYFSFKVLNATLNKNESKILNLLALCENGISVNLIEEFFSCNDLCLNNTLDDLFTRNIIEENVFMNHNLIRIKSKIFLKYFKEKIINVRFVDNHLKIAEIYKKLLATKSKDYFYLLELKYHFSFTTKNDDIIYYCLLHLEYILNFYDEFFPTTKNNEWLSSNYFDRIKIYHEFDLYEEMINKFDIEISDEKLNLIQMLFNFLKGRTLIRDGKRENGIKYINVLIKIAEDLNNVDFLLRGYLETILYGLKNDNKEIMKKYINKAYEIETLENYSVEKGVLLRLEGLTNIMEKNFNDAEYKIKKSLEIFENYQLINSNYFNIAAGFDYLGIISREKKFYDEAIFYFNKSIKICLDKKVKKNLDIFYMDLGYTLFLKKEYEKAEIIFKKSLEVYDEYGTYWLRSIVESCLSLLYLYKGNNNKSLEHFRRAEIHSKKDYVKEELLVLENTRKELLGKVL